MNIVEKIQNDEMVFLNEECEVAPPLRGRRKKDKAEIVKTVPVRGKHKTKDGKRVRVGTKIVDSDGVTKTLLTPAGKTAKAAEELRRGVKITNDGQVKTNKNGKPQKLTKAQKAYRRGRLDQARDSAKCYNAQGGKKK